MSIQKVKITNFKSFQGSHTIELNSGLNIIVGNNDEGKSTIIEAIHMALTGYYHGRSIANEITEYIFNKRVVEDYCKSLKSPSPLPPPNLSIEIFFDDLFDANYQGQHNSENNKLGRGLKLDISFDDRFYGEYNTLLQKSKNIQTLPVEYYKSTWTSFADKALTPRQLPMKSALIEASNTRSFYGADLYISKILKNSLTTSEIISVAQAYRSMKESFMSDKSIEAINQSISQHNALLDGKITIGVDLGSRNNWESSLVTQVDDIPFDSLGKGTQAILKTEIALNSKTQKDENEQILLIEEPESHLSHSRLNQLISSIQTKYRNKQIVITTHSSFVANKLGLANLLLLHDHNVLRPLELKSASFFQKLPGFDTLRMLLCKRAILVEGASDELLVQKAYQLTKGKLPIEDGVEVISVGLTFLRFLEIAESLKLRVDVVSDVDWSLESFEKKYKNYIKNNKKPNIRICYDRDFDSEPFQRPPSCEKFNYNTLEPKLLKANNYDLETFNAIFGNKFDSIPELAQYMIENKTDCALKLFSTQTQFKIPNYILESIQDEE
ncbi:MAG: AAA family ATPase [Sutterella parvirubra]|nr:AAA family ATPase [Sutterella parvirubra]